MKKIATQLAYFRELWLWPLLALACLFGSIFLVRWIMGRSPADDLGDIVGVNIAAAPVCVAAFLAVLLDGHLYWAMTREEWKASPPLMATLDSAKPIFIFVIILIFEYFYLRH